MTPTRIDPRDNGTGDPFASPVRAASPTETTDTERKSRFSPPAAPRPPRYGACNFFNAHPSSESMLLEINSGRSILRPKPGDTPKVFLKAPRKMRRFFEHEEADISRTHQRAVPAFLLVPPSFPQLPHGIEGPGDCESDEDMPQLPSRINLRLRPSRQRPLHEERVVTVSPEGHRFLPIQPDGDWDQERYTGS